MRIVLLSTLAIAFAFPLSARAADSGGETPAAYVERRAKELADDDLYGHLELAEIAKSTGQGEAAIAHANKVLALDDENELAHELLGHTRHKGKWLTPEEAAAAGLVEFRGEWMTSRDYDEHEARSLWEGEGDNVWVYEDRKEKLTLKTNTSRRKMVKYVNSFLQFKRDMQRTFGVKLSSKSTVHVYATKEEYHLIGRGPRGSGGYYSPGDREFHFFDDPDFFQARRIFFHEATHMFVNLTAKNKAFRFPMWLNEGMAEYFGGSRFDYEEGAYTFGHVLNDRLEVIQRAIKRGRHTPLETFIGSEGRAGAYDQGWSLVLFLVQRDDGKYAGRFGKFLSLMRDSRLAMRLNERGPEYLDYFKKLFLKRGQTMQEFEEEWKQYVLALRPEPGAPDFRTMQSMR